MVATTNDNAVNVGTLESFEWKVSCGMSSSSCKNLNTLIVTVVMTVVDASGRNVRRTMELSYEQFKDFSKQLKDAKSLLSTS